ncbi:hydroxypyruvate isomerase [Tistlia consotensis]|uniref:Hydroxypyruvate isomerase n=1 Tax=Tistlia consotensis USBA 355 TaxID=560819 RepID=A0A1Y6B6A4_9PROT|nr:TIM barrel protein [Tistlia consotensis]SME90155.1 hydroxypyruvate isomerase [Tistlia consotensis USBA 355]SNR26582.1 hydroxypyruvate isomerase [Tistlia consotensis]
MPRFSANLGFLWPGRPLLERVEAAARAGFRAIELHWPYETPAAEMKAACARLGLTLLGINTVVGDAAKGESGLGALPGREADFQASVDQSVAWCRGSGAVAIHCMAGVVPPEQKAAARETLLRNLEAAAAKAEGLTLLLEPLNPRDKPGYFYSTVGEAAAIIAELGRPNVKLMFDAYHVGVTEGDILTRLERHLPIIGHVQIAAVPSRHEPDEGEIAYRAVFERLDSLGYAGWVGAEYLPRGDTDAGLVWTRHLGVTL